MRILFTDIYNAKFKMGGVEKVLFELARSVKEDYQEEVACAVNSGDLSEQLKAAGIPATEIYWPKLRTPETLRQFSKLISSFRPQVIHSHHRYLTFLLDHFFKNEAKIIHTEHLCYSNWKSFYRYGHLVTAVHESIRQNLICSYHVPSECVVTIPNAVRLPEPNPEKLQRLKEGYSETLNRVRILFIGRLEEQKGHRYLIEAVGQLSRRHREKIRIFLAGEGSLGKSLKEKVQREGLESSFIFLGHSTDIAELLAFCDLLVLPSLWEGMPLVILEAYSVGKPAVASDTPGSKELIKPNETGLLVPRRDSKAIARALEQMIERPEQIKSMGRQAQEWWSKEFSFKKMVSRYYEIYGRWKNF